MPMPMPYKGKAPPRTYKRAGLAAGALAVALSLVLFFAGRELKDIAVPVEEEPAPAKSVLLEFQALQNDYCNQHLHELQEPTLQDNDTMQSYTRVDGIKAGAGRSDKQISMWIYSNHDFVSVNIKGKGAWEAGETLQIIDTLEAFEKETGLPREEVVFMDIGANIGWFAVNIASMGYKVLAVEPMFNNLGALRRSVCGIPQLQQNITIINKGLSDVPQTCSFYADPSNLGNGYTGCGTDDQNATMPGKVFRGKFDVTRLDDLFDPETLAALTGKLALIKIDVEGFEQRIFSGARKFIATVKPKYILAEVNGPAMKATTGATPEDMFKLYASLGYDVYSGGFNKWLQKPEEFATLGKRSGADWDYANFYMIRKPELL